MIHSLTEKVKDRLLTKDNLTMSDKQIEIMEKAHIDWLEDKTERILLNYTPLNSNTISINKILDISEKTLAEIFLEYLKPKSMFVEHNKIAKDLAQIAEGYHSKPCL